MTYPKWLNEVIAANKKYASNFGAKKDLALPPARRFAILTCMDARLDPAKYAGLSEGDAHVIRNAGGRASDDAIRSLVISHKLLGTREWFVIHHTNCGMELFTDAALGLRSAISFDVHQGVYERNLKLDLLAAQRRRTRQSGDLVKCSGKLGCSFDQGRSAPNERCPALPQRLRCSLDKSGLGAVMCKQFAGGWRATS